MGSASWFDVRLHDVFAAARRDRADALAHTAKSIALSGTFLHEQYGGRFYAMARNLVPVLRAAYDEALSRYDVLVMPSTPMRATLLPGPEASLAELIHHAFEVNASVCGFNLTGHPAMSIPVGDGEGLPIGMMAIGGRFKDETVLRFARACESSGIAAPAGIRTS
jgi:amidase